MAMKVFDLLAEIDAKLSSIFDERLKAIYLLDSFARRDQDVKSDKVRWAENW